MPYLPDEEIAYRRKFSILAYLTAKEESYHTLGGLANYVCDIVYPFKELILKKIIRGRKAVKDKDYERLCNIEIPELVKTGLVKTFGPVYYGITQNGKDEFMRLCTQHMVTDDERERFLQLIKNNHINRPRKLLHGFLSRRKLSLSRRTHHLSSGGL